MQNSTFWGIVDKHLDRIEFKHVLGLAVLGFSFYVIKLILLHQLPTTGDNYAMQIITGLLAMDGTVLAFFYASTASSQKKDATIASMANNASQTNTLTP